MGEQQTRRCSRIGGRRSQRIAPAVASAAALALMIGVWSFLAPATDAAAATAGASRPAVVTSWGPTIPLAPGETGAELVGVSCPAPGYCTAVGISEAGTTEPATVTETAGRWGPLVVHPLLSGA